MSAHVRAVATFKNRLPDPDEIENAKRLLKFAVSFGTGEGESEEVRLALGGNEEQQTAVLAPALAASLLEMLKYVSSGCGFHVIPIEPELTAQQAADILNVPRPYLVKLLEEGEIPYAIKRRHRRIRADDLFAYKKKRDRVRSDALNELIQFDQENGLL